MAGASVTSAPRRRRPSDSSAACSRARAMIRDCFLEDVQVTTEVHGETFSDSESPIYRGGRGTPGKLKGRADSFVFPSVKRVPLEKSTKPAKGEEREEPPVCVPQEAFLVSLPDGTRRFRDRKGEWCRPGLDDEEDKKEGGTSCLELRDQLSILAS